MKKFFTLFALVLMSCMGAWAQTTWSHTDLTNGKKVQFRSYYENTKKLGVNSAGTALETTAAQNTKFIIAESETAGQYYLYDPTTKRYVSKATGSNSSSGETMNVTASKTDAGKFSFVASTATGQDDSKPKICIQCMNPVGTNVMIHHASGTEAKAYGAANTVGYGGNGWQIVSLENATDEEMRDINGPTEEDITALQTKISEVYAQCNTLGVKRVGYPNYTTNSEAIDALFLYTDNFVNSITSSNYDAALAALNAVYALTDVNLPEAGKAYRIYNVTKNGTKRVVYYDGTTLKITSNGTTNVPDGKEGVFVCGQDGQKFFFTNNSGNYFRVSSSDKNKAASASYGEMVNSNNVNALTISKMATVNSCTDAQRFGLLMIKGYADFSGNNAQGEHYLMGSNSSNFVQGEAGLQMFEDAAQSIGFLFEEVEFPYTTKTLNDGGDGNKYATVALPYAMEIPEGVKAYAATESGDVLVLTDATESSQNVAKGAYILVSESATSAAVLPAAANPAAVENNNLEGSITTVPSGSLYVLNKTAEEGVGFYKFNGAYNTLLGKAYLPSSAAANKLSFRFEDVVTAISAIEGNSKNVEIFDLQGRRLEKAQKGMNIINGHKVLVK